MDYSENTLKEKLKQYYDHKKCFRRGKELRVLELAYLSYTGANIYNSARYTFTYKLMNRNENRIDILRKMYDFKPDIVVTQDSTAWIKEIFEHKNILYVYLSDYGTYIYLLKKRKWKRNEIGVHFQNEKIIQQVCNKDGVRHIVPWNYIADANFLDADIQISKVFQTDIIVAGTNHSSLSRLRKYLKGNISSWMRGSEKSRKEMLRALDMMIEELYIKMDITGALIETKREYADIFHEVIQKNNLQLDFFKEISGDDMDYFYEWLLMTVGCAVFRYLIVKWIIERGYKVDLWGEAWQEEETTNKYYKGVIESREELKQAYNSAKICLFTNPYLSIHFSVFEMIGSKSLCLAYENDKVSRSRLLSEYFEDGKSIALYHSRDELFAKLDHYLVNLQHRELVIEEGHKFIMENNMCWENELSKAMHQAVKQAEENGMFQ